MPNELSEPLKRQFLLLFVFQAKGELEAARVEIDGLKEDKAVLTQALETKAREIRMQLLQVWYAASKAILFLWFIGRWWLAAVSSLQVFRLEHTPPHPGCKQTGGRRVQAPQ